MIIPQEPVSDTTELPPMTPPFEPPDTAEVSILQLFIEQREVLYQAQAHLDHARRVLDLIAVRIGFKSATD